LWLRSRTTALLIRAPRTSARIKTNLLASAIETANGAPIAGVARAVNTDSLTPIPPGTPIAINPMSQDDAVKKNISAMETSAPNADAVIEVDSDIKIQAGVCKVV
jgi:hypothetical protein